MQTSPPERRRPRVTVIEDDPVMGGSLEQRLSLEQYDVDWYCTAAAAVAAVRARGADAVVCDIRLPDRGGEELYEELRPMLSGAPVIFITGYGQIDQAVRLVKAGAADYLTKPFEIRALLDRLGELVGEPEAGGELGRSEAMRSLEATLRRVADLDSTLLITGETGAGKEVAARFAHSVSSRAAKPFVAVNCAAIPDSLIESELFGHERGAFTGADRPHEGYLERVRGGTLFLDEIGDLPQGTQTKLLRVLQERAFTRLGGTRLIKLDGRVACATHRDLAQMVAEGRFRQDLYYRVSVIPVAVAPLRDRKADILPLMEAMAAEFSSQFGRDVRGFSPEARRRAMDHLWPGNVRELRNRVERAVALAQGPMLGAGDLFPERDAEPRPERAGRSLADVRLDAENRHIQDILEETGGQVEEAARRLGVSRSSLFERLRRIRK